MRPLPRVRPYVLFQVEGLGKRLHRNGTVAVMLNMGSGGCSYPSADVALGPRPGVLRLEEVEYLVIIRKNSISLSRGLHITAQKYLVASHSSSSALLSTSLAMDPKVPL